jgi:hypothetical protein
MRKLTERRWAIESPAYGLIVLDKEMTREEARLLVPYERGRKLVRAVITWTSRRNKDGTKAD